MTGSERDVVDGRGGGGTDIAAPQQDGKRIGLGCPDLACQDARSTQFRHQLDSGGGSAAISQKGHAGVVHPADQPCEMRAARKAAGGDGSGPKSPEGHAVVGFRVNLNRRIALRRIQPHIEQRIGPDLIRARCHCVEPIRHRLAEACKGRQREGGENASEWADPNPPPGVDWEDRESEGRLRSPGSGRVAGTLERRTLKLDFFVHVQSRSRESKQRCQTCQELRIPDRGSRP